MDKLKPYGSLNMLIYEGGDASKPAGLPIADFRGTAAQYAEIYDKWFADLKEHVWPEWVDTGTGWDWEGGATQHAQDATHRELILMKEKYQDAGILNKMITIAGEHPKGDVEHRTHQWHYDVEDTDHSQPGRTDFETLGALGNGANFLGYWPGIKPGDFHQEFWYRKAAREPNVLGIKLRFQRPRPYTTAWVFGMPDFTWRSAQPIRHTGVHPAFLSGHCYQGLIHSSNILQNWRRKEFDLPEAQISALKQYAVDWGDRRVFAGVHYPTDNVASWVLALRVARWLFDEELGDEIVDFIKDALLKYSHVYKDLAEAVQVSENASLLPAFNLLTEELKNC